MSYYGNNESNQFIPLQTSTHDGSPGDESMYDYIAGYNDDNEETPSLFDFEDESQLIVDIDNPSNQPNPNNVIEYYDEFDGDSFFDDENDIDELSQLYNDTNTTQQSQESQIQINFDDFENTNFPISNPPSPTPNNNTTNDRSPSPSPATTTKPKPNNNTSISLLNNNNTNTLTIPHHIINNNTINNISNQLVERQHHYHLAVVAASPQFKSNNNNSNNTMEGKDMTALNLGSNNNNNNNNNNSNTNDRNNKVNNNNNSNNNNNNMRSNQRYSHSHSHNYVRYNSNYNGHNYNNPPYYNNSNVENWQKSMWKSHGGARRFFMPLPNRRFTLMHHHEIEQVLRKQLSHMMLPDPLNADFYCGVTHAREGKIWEGFGVPGLNHVYIKKSHKYPRNNDGSPILPPGTLGKTAGFVSVHAPKSMISINNINTDNDGDESGTGIGDNEGVCDLSTFDVFTVVNMNLICDFDDMLLNNGYRNNILFTDKYISKQIEIGYDHLMLFERCNASIFYVHQESECRMIYNTTNGLINSRSQRNDMNIFNICLQSRDQTMKNLINFLDLNHPDKVFYRLLSIDKGRKLIYRIFVLFEANHNVFITMLKLLCAKIYLYATIQQGKKISDQDIQFPDKLKYVLIPKEYHLNTNNYNGLYKKYLTKKQEFETFKQEKQNNNNNSNSSDEKEIKKYKETYGKLKQELSMIENRLNYLKEIIPPRLSCENALIIFKLMIKNIENFKYIQDRKLLFKSRLVCCIISVIIKLSKPNDNEWINCFTQLFNLLGNDLTFLVPGLTRLQQQKQQIQTQTQKQTQTQAQQQQQQQQKHHNHHRTYNPFSDNIVIPSIMTSKELEISSNPNVHRRGNVFMGEEYYKLTGKNLIQWSVLIASPRIRWELVCDIFIGCNDSNAKQLYNLQSFWQSVKEGMFYYPPARFIAHKNAQLKQELYSYFNKIKEKARIQMESLKRSHSHEEKQTQTQKNINENKHNQSDEKTDNNNNNTVKPPNKLNELKRSQSDPVTERDTKNLHNSRINNPKTNTNNNVISNNNNNNSSTNNPHPYSHPSSMHHYVHQMRGWLNVFKKNELKQLEKEREHQINMEKQTKRQREYDKMLQQKKDAQNERFKQQFFKQLKEKGIEKGQNNENNSDNNNNDNSNIIANNNEINNKPKQYKHLKSSPKTNEIIIHTNTTIPKQNMIKTDELIKDKVTIKPTTSNIDKKFEFEVDKDLNVIQKSKNLRSISLPITKKDIPPDDSTLDNISSCSSSDNGSFMSLGIGIDPFTLNNRYYQNIIKTNNNTIVEKTDLEKQREEHEKRMLEAKQREIDEREMMLAHGMQQIKITPQTHSNNSHVIRDRNNNINNRRDRNNNNINRRRHNNNRHLNNSHSNNYSNKEMTHGNGNYNTHLISPGPNILHSNRHSRNRYYGHGHGSIPKTHSNHTHYYSSSSSNGVYNSNNNISQQSEQQSVSRKREHYQYNRSYRRDKYVHNHNHRDKYSHGHRGDRDRDRDRDKYYDEYYSNGDRINNNALPPRMRQGLDKMGGGKSRDKKKSKYRDRDRDRRKDGHSSRRDRNKDNKSHKMKSNRNKNIYYDDKDRSDRSDRSDRDRYRNRDNHNSSRYYQYKNQYSNNSKQYNYSRKTRR